MNFEPFLSPKRSNASRVTVSVNESPSTAMSIIALESVTLLSSSFIELGPQCAQELHKLKTPGEPRLNGRNRALIRI